MQAASISNLCVFFPINWHVYSRLLCNLIYYIFAHRPLIMLSLYSTHIHKTISNIDGILLHTRASEIKLVTSMRNLWLRFQSSIYECARWQGVWRSVPRLVKDAVNPEVVVRGIKQDSDSRIHHASCGLLQLVAVCNYWSTAASAEGWCACSAVCS